MKSNYKCFIDIHLSGGDIQFDVSDDIQLFSFKSGLGFIAIPHFLFTLAQLYKGKIKEARLDCHGNTDYYSFISDGVNLFIVYTTNYPEEKIYNYQFILEKYLEAIDEGFKKYLKQLESEGLLPLKTQDYAHPLGDGVLNAFYDFSSLIHN
ncbi:hypothetical protein J2Z40_003490 [Cytobacillus eiseniae]|uniref:Uncharacterized protein n=1 Tax=Cytobacillus eiseniae TaxID=762947 RepID=A0ABS4RJ35_9BACI|nr:hypothetical protein [Cytobacillus eiseniae]MBP2242908.1 hypothetical protein [Cytobacillus eiseniae]